MENRATWKAFADGDMAARDMLLTENLSLVHHVARQLERKLSNELDHDELVGAGTLGLMAAMNSFDANRGLAFSTFAVPRIRGAILDELRRQDHVPRSVRRKTRDITTARNALAAKLYRAPEDVEVAEALGVDVQTLWKWSRMSKAPSAFRSTARRTIAAKRTHRHSTYSTPIHRGAVDEQLGREQEVTMLREAIMKLKEQERTVLALYYFEELKLHEIAEILGADRVARVANSLEGVGAVARDDRHRVGVVKKGNGKRGGSLARVAREGAARRCLLEDGAGLRK